MMRFTYKFNLGKKFVLIYFLFLLINTELFAQSAFVRDASVPVSTNSGSLTFPWAGGFNNPQISNIDLNNDGIKDIFVFDRSNARTYTFINLTNTQFSYEPSLADSFPLLHDWALLLDYNGDGKEDIFTSAELGADIGITVFRNDSKNNELKFTAVHPPLLKIPSENIYISQWDIPAISDLDSDGDIDILNFDFSGAAMYMYKNLSMEKYGIPDSLDYIRSDACYGKFMEDFADCTVTLNIACKGNTSQPDSVHVQNYHAGSTILAFDANGDKPKELLIGDIICPYMYKLTNIGDSANALFANYDKNYPSSSPVDVTRFPAGFLVDVNNDQIKDLLVAPNALNVSNSIKSLTHYHNAGSNSIPDFQLANDDFLQENMIDVGEFSYPVFFDENADGLMDLLIGNFKYYESPGKFSSRLFLYRNIGTAANPAFTFISNNAFNLKDDLNKEALFPAFGDLDADGDNDMLVGDADGKIHYYENSAGKGNPVNMFLKFPLYLGIDVGQNASPQIVDVNNDNLPDLIIGEKDGNLNYYQNTGTAQSPDFKLISNTWGNVNVKINELTDANSIPFLTDLDNQCDRTLFVGSGSGRIFRYTHIDQNIDGTFVKDLKFTTDIKEGTGTAVSFADINNDGYKDMVIGNRGGGVAFYKNTKAPISCAVDTSKALSFKVEVIPNPTKDLFYINVQGTDTKDRAEVSIYDALGRKVISHSENCGFPKTNMKFDSEGLAAGVYIYHIKLKINSTSEEKIEVGRLMIVK